MSQCDRPLHNCFLMLYNPGGICSFGWDTKPVIFLLFVAAKEFKTAGKTAECTLAHTPEPESRRDERISPCCRAGGGWREPSAGCVLLDGWWDIGAGQEAPQPSSDSQVPGLLCHTWEGQRQGASTFGTFVLRAGSLRPHKRSLLWGEGSQAGCGESAGGEGEKLWHFTVSELFL